jgi:thiamine-monophosphate kinase
MTLSQRKASVVGMSDSSAPLDRTLGEIGENAALDWVLPLLPAGDSVVVGPGDDSALVTLPESEVLISTDMMMQGTDFRFDWSRPADVGFKAIASNAADIAAMGGVVVGYQLAVAASASTPLRMLVGLAEGCAEGIAEFTPGAGVLGGDLSRSEVFTITVTVLGSLRGRRPVLRSGATPGDVVCVAGELGLSHRGLRLLLAAGDDELEIAGLVRSDTAVAHHLRPRPPIALGPQAAKAGATAMMDISDGLVLDAFRMAKASGVRVELASDAGLDDDALAGGEDHGLLATFPPSVTPPDGFRPVGVIGKGEPGVFLGGQELDATAGGWDPFRNLAQ